MWEDFYWKSADRIQNPLLAKFGAMYKSGKQENQWSNNLFMVYVIVPLHDLLFWPRLHIYIWNVKQKEKDRFSLTES